jgi:hypothetical protein
MPSDLIRGWTLVRVKKTRQIKNPDPSHSNDFASRLFTIGRD